jgi:hypothetical protein
MDFRKNTQLSKFMKILSVGAELLHAVRQTDMMKLILRKSLKSLMFVRTKYLHILHVSENSGYFPKHH